MLLLAGKMEHPGVTFGNMNYTIQMDQLKEGL
jgi:hypothetical protein